MQQVEIDLMPISEYSTNLGLGKHVEINRKSRPKYRYTNYIVIESVSGFICIFSRSRVFYFIFCVVFIKYIGVVRTK